jgi:hypothetical protein
MLVILALVYIITALNSCSYPPELPYPSPEEGLALLPGEYRVEAVAVKEVDCGGAAPEGFVGQVAYGTLEADPDFGASAVRFDLDGVPMTGRMESGWLNLRGALDAPAPEVDESADEASASGSSADDCAEAETTDTGTESVPECVPGSPPSGAVATLKAFATSEVHADGTLAVRTAACSYLLDVTLDREDDGAEPEPVEDTGSVPYPGDDTASQPCDAGADCG